MPSTLPCQCHWRLVEEVVFSENHGNWAKSVFGWKLSSHYNTIEKERWSLSRNQGNEQYECTISWILSSQKQQVWRRSIVDIHILIYNTDNNKNKQTQQTSNNKKSTTSIYTVVIHNTDHKHK